MPPTGPKGPHHGPNNKATARGQRGIGPAQPVVPPDPAMAALSDEVRRDILRELKGALAAQGKDMGTLLAECMTGKDRRTRLAAMQLLARDVLVRSSAGKPDLPAVPKVSDVATLPARRPDPAKVVDFER